MSDWASFKKLILEEIYKGLLKLESFNNLDVPDNVVSKVVSTIIAAEKVGIRVEWIDKVIGEIGVRRDHFELLREARLLRIQFEEFHEQMGRLGRRLAELDI